MNCHLIWRECISSGFWIKRKWTFRVCEWRQSPHTIESYLFAQKHFSRFFSFLFWTSEVSTKSNWSEAKEEIKISTIFDTIKFQCAAVCQCDARVLGLYWKHCARTLKTVVLTFQQLNQSEIHQPKSKATFFHRLTAGYDNLLQRWVPHPPYTGIPAETSVG